MTLISEKKYLMIGEDINNCQFQEWVTFDSNTMNLFDYLNDIQGDKMCIIRRYSDGYERAIVNNGCPFTWGHSITTNHKHYERNNRGVNWTAENIPPLSTTPNWNTIDEITLDKNIFPNGNNTIVDSRLWLNVVTHVVIDETINPELVYEDGDEIKKYEDGVLVSNEPPIYEKVLKPNLISYYKYLANIKFAEIRNAWFTDIGSRQF